MLKVKGKFGEYIIEEKEGKVFLDNKEQIIDLKSLDDRRMHVIKNNKSYRVEVEKVDAKKKNFVLKINGRPYTFQASDEMDLLLEQLGMDKLETNVVEDLRAPMPGLVIDINVNEGQEVKKGDPLVILEAMKMENLLKSPGDLVVKEIKVQKGETVEKNAVLIKF